MSPRLASMMTSAPWLRAASTVRCSTAIPAGPWRSKNADCGLMQATSGAQTSTMPSQNAHNPSASSGNPQPLRLSAEGSIPTHSAERSAARAANRIWNGTVIPLSYNRPRGEETSQTNFLVIPAKAGTHRRASSGRTQDAPAVAPYESGIARQEMDPGLRRDDIGGDVTKEVALQSPQPRTTLALTPAVEDNPHGNDRRAPHPGPAPARLGAAQRP